jgi:hypothetical protein
MWDWFECLVCMSDVAPRLPKRLGLGVVMRRYAFWFTKSRAPAAGPTTTRDRATRWGKKWTTRLPTPTSLPEELTRQDARAR